MNRRRVLVVVGTAGGATLSGCMELLGKEKHELPEEPDRITEGTALEYVEAYEEAWLYNHMLTRDHTELSIGCSAAIDLKEDDGFYMFTFCRGASTVEDYDGSVSKGSTGPRRRFYFVSDDDIQRIVARRDESGPSYGSGRGGRELQGFQLVNFDESEHTVEIDIRYREEDDSVLETEYRIDPGWIITRTGVTAIEGVYDLSVTLETGNTATYEWELDDIGAVFGVNIYITRTGEIRFGTNTQPGRTPRRRDSSSRDLE